MKKAMYVLILAVMLFIPLAFAEPSINFTAPTPENNSIINTTYIPINISVEGIYNSSTFIDLDNSLIGWWRMDDVNQSGTGATVYDYTGKYNGTAYGNSLQTDYGKLGKGFNFTGFDDYISFSNTINLQGSFTITAWVRANWYYVDGIVTKDVVGARSFGFETYGNQLRFERSGAWVISTTGPVMPYNEWTFVEAVYNGVTLTIKTNRSATASAAMSPLVSTSANVRIGAKAISGQNFFNGTIDDVMIFNRSLNNDELNAIYDNQSSYYLTTNLSVPIDFHTFKAYSQDTAGNVNSTETRQVSGHRFWDYQAYVRDILGNPIENVNISAYNVSGDFQFSLLTNSTGWTNKTSITDYFNLAGTRVYYSDYVISAVNNSIEYNFTRNITRLQNFIDILILKDKPSILINSPINITYSYSNILFDVNSTETGLNGSIVPNLDSTLMGWWRMDDISGTKVIDYMGKYNGTATYFANQTHYGYFGKGFNFRGYYVSNTVGDSISMGNVLGFTHLSNFSISIWARREGNIWTGKNVMGIIGKGIYTSGYFGCDFTMPSTIGCGVRRSSTYTRATYSVREDNLTNWTHIVFTYNASDATGIKMYINGNLTGNASTSGITTSFASSSPFCIGCTGGLGGNIAPFNGTLDDAMVFNRTLLPDEIMALYNATPINHLSNLSTGYHNYTVYTQDVNGDVNSSNISFWIIINRTYLYQAYVNNSCGSSVEGANISVYNVSGDYQFSLLTNSTGWTNQTSILDYIDDGIKHYYSNYTVNASVLATYLGNNLVTDGDFITCPNGWTDNGDWFCGNNDLRIGNILNSKRGVFNQSIDIAIGKNYNVSLNLLFVLSLGGISNLTIELGGINISIDLTTTGIKSFLVTPINTNDFKIHGYTSAGNSIFVDDASVKEVMPIDAYIPISHQWNVSQKQNTIDTMTFTEQNLAYNPNINCSCGWMFNTPQIIDADYLSLYGLGQISLNFKVTTDKLYFEEGCRFNNLTSLRFR